MKGPVILLMVALTVLIDQAASNHVFSRPSVKRSMDISTLLVKLSNPMPGKAIQGPSKVFECLFVTIDKEKTDPRLKGFTVGQLVALNEWSVEDCENNELEERRSICKKFSTRELTNLVRPLKRETSDGDLVTSSADQIDLNVGKFCWRIIEHMERLCPAKRVQALREDKAVSKRLSSFGNQVSFGEMTLRQLFNPDFRKLVAQKLEKLEKKDAKEAAALKENCSFMVNEFSKPEASFEMDPALTHELAICEMIMKLDEVEGQPEATQFANDNQASS